MVVLVPIIFRVVFFNKILISKVVFSKVLLLFQILPIVLDTNTLLDIFQIPPIKSGLDTCTFLWLLGLFLARLFPELFKLFVILPLLIHYLKYVYLWSYFFGAFHLSEDCIRQTERISFSLPLKLERRY